MKTSDKLLREFVVESLTHQHTHKQSLLVEFLQSAIEMAERNVEGKAEDEKKKSAADPTDATKDKVGSSTSGKMFKPIGTEAEATDSEDEEKKKKIIDNTEKLELLKNVNSSFKSTKPIVKRTEDNINRLIAKLVTAQKSNFRKSVLQVGNIYKANMAKYYQKLADNFKDAGDEQDAMVRLALMTVVLKMIQEMEDK